MAAAIIAIRAASSKPAAQPRRLAYISVATTTNELCISGTGCTSYIGLNAPQGIAVDGDGNLWIANSGDASVAMLTYSSAATYTPMAVSPVAYKHDASNGGTMSNPYGIALDASGNVWVTNADASASPSPIAHPRT